MQLSVVLLTLTASVMGLPNPAAAPLKNNISHEKRQGWLGLFMTTDVNWHGNTSNMWVAPQTCTNIELWWSNKISSFGPDPGVHCFVYTKRDCFTNGNSAPWASIGHPGNGDLRNLKDAVTGADWNDKIASVRCWWE